jgi:DNA-binding MarR family transcriptional regulator
VLIELGRLIERRMQQRLSEYEVTAGQFMALTCIAAKPGSSRADLARVLRISPQAVGGLSQHLVTKRLISRTNPPRGLPTEFTMTTAGRHLLSHSDPLMQGMMREMLKFVHPNLVRTLDGALRHLLLKLA